MKKSEIKPGTILVSMWGYNCCRFTFYIIEKITENFCWLHPIEKYYKSGSPNSPYSEVKPFIGGHKGKTIRRKIKECSGSIYISVSDYESIHCVYDENNTYSECCD